MMIEFDLDTSWIAGKHSNGEINTTYGYVSIPKFWSDGSDLYLQGDEAEEAIQEIHQIWLSNNCTQQEAINVYINIYSH